MLSEILARLLFPSAGAGFRVYPFAESERGKFCRYDAALGWSGIPNVADSFEWIDAHCRVRQNSYGFRGQAYNFLRSKQERWAMLGDSYVWGFGVDEEDLFTEILSSRTGNTLEAVNLGVSGYGTDQEYLLWSRLGFRWKPDRVFLFIDVNTDLHDNISLELYNHAKPLFRFDASGRPVLTNSPVPKPGKVWEEHTRQRLVDKAPLAHWLLIHSRVASLLVEAMSRSELLSRKLDEAQIVPLLKAGYVNEYPLYAHREIPQLRAAWARLANILRILNSDVRKAGATLTIVVVPSPIQVYPKTWDRFVAENPFPKESFDPSVPDLQIARIASRLGIQVIDPIEQFRKAALEGGRLYFPLNYHWTPEGHRLIADILLKETRKS